MCGLVGVAGALESKDEEVFQRLLVADYFRGKESTGMAAVRRTDDVFMAKLHSHPWDLFDTGRFKTALSAFNSKAFIGHNRAATSGRVNAVNAHPFMFDHIVGAHNGTLPLLMHRKLERITGEEYPVDSMALIAAIAKEGLKETIEQIKGSWALTYFDLKENTINFLRNNHRPLYYAWSDDFKKIYWASEWRMIEYAVHGADLKVWRRKEDGAGYFQLPEDQHFSLSIDKLIAGGKVPPKFKSREVKEDPKADVTHYLGFGAGVRGTNSPGQDPFGRDVWEDDWENYNSHENGDNVLPFMPGAVGGHSQTGSSKTGKGSKNSTDSNGGILFLNGTVNNPFAGRLSKENFESIACQGCQWCGKKIEWGDIGIAVYLNEEIVLCSEHAPGTGEKGNRLYVTGPLAA